MEIELKSEPKSRNLNSAVAMTVVVLSMVMAVGKIKDDNIVQAMQVAKATTLDTWNEYQAARIKMRMAESTLTLANAAPATQKAALEGALAELGTRIAKYETTSGDLQQKAKDLEASYDAMNFRDDQFDVSEAGMSISLSLAAVAALTELWWLLATSWVFGFFGVGMTVAAYMQWPIHPDWLVSFLT